MIDLTKGMTRSQLTEAEKVHYAALRPPPKEYDLLTLASKSYAGVNGNRRYAKSWEKVK